MTDRLFVNKQIPNKRVARPVSRRAFVLLAVIAVIGSLVTFGFVLSAERHFAVVTLGYEGERLRRQAQELEEKLNRLEYERARAASPLELERRARSIGLERPSFKAGEDARNAGTKSDGVHR
jgi:hypothetical protein